MTERKSAMTATGDRQARRPIGIVSMTATGQTREGRVEVSIQLANAPGIGGEKAWLHSRLTRRVMAAVNLRSIGSSPDGSIHVELSADSFELGVRAIRQAVNDFNEASDASLLGEERQDVERREAEQRAKRDRLVPYQEVIDRVMGE